MARGAHSLAQTDHAPAEHPRLHRHAADQQSTAICADLPPTSRAKAVHTGRQPTSRAQSCAYRQAAHQQSTKLCIQAGSPPAEHKAVHTGRQPTSRAKAVHTGRQPTSRGVVRSVVERRNLKVFLQAVKPVLKLPSSLLIQGAHWLAEVPVGGRGIQVQARRGVVSQHPGKDWILVQVIECTPGQCVQLHRSNFPSYDLLSWEAFRGFTYKRIASLSDDRVCFVSLSQKYILGESICTC